MKLHGNEGIRLRHRAGPNESQKEKEWRKWRGETNNRAKKARKWATSEHQRGKQRGKKNCRSPSRSCIEVTRSTSRFPPEHPFIFVLSFIFIYFCILLFVFSFLLGWCICNVTIEKTHVMFFSEAFSPGMSERNLEIRCIFHLFHASFFFLVYSRFWGENLSASSSLPSTPFDPLVSSFVPLSFSISSTDRLFSSSSYATLPTPIQAAGLVLRIVRHFFQKTPPPEQE